MKKIDLEAELKVAILLLESKQAEEEKMLKEQFHLTYESVKPINMIKNTFKEVVSSQDLKEDFTTTMFGLTAGFLSKIIVEKITRNPLKKLVGTAVMYSVRKAIVNNPEAVKLFSQFVLKHIFRKKEMNTAKS
ncbi:MAG TPA: hypothetical protein DCG69_03105 [Bacteroidales bacterium]|nr:hypothetical protein [Bacteroidales bacterium]